VLVQYPDTSGVIHDYAGLVRTIKDAGAVAVMAADPLALTLLTPPASSGPTSRRQRQRFGVPMGGGGPHAAYMATHESNIRKMPGRIVGVSKTRTVTRRSGSPSRRGSSTSAATGRPPTSAPPRCCSRSWRRATACTTGPSGLTPHRQPCAHVHARAPEGLNQLGHDAGTGAGLRHAPRQGAGDPAAVLARAAAERINLRDFGDGTIGVTLDETVGPPPARVIDLLTRSGPSGRSTSMLLAGATGRLPDGLARTSAFMEHEAFRKIQTETEMLRYLRQMQDRDLSLAHDMIPLGSCTMKLNGTSEMIPVTWPEFSNIHPFAPADQTKGYAELYEQLESWLCEITGFDAVSLQPNAGSQGEYAGLLAIRAYHHSKGDTHRDICLVPESAHGTNPASAVMAGMKVVPIKSTPRVRSISMTCAKAEKHATISRRSW
jgi:glycine dehydrogenase